MIVDSSALLAVVFREDDAPQFAEAMARAEHLRIFAASWFEAAMAVDRRGDAVARRRFDSFVEEFDIRVEAVTYEQAQFALVRKGCAGLREPAVQGLPRSCATDRPPPAPACVRGFPR